MSLPNQTNILAASCIGYADGTLVATGTFSIQATDANNNAIPFNGGNDVQATLAPVVWPITTGSLPTSGPPQQIATPANTEPANIFYRIIITDTSKSPTVVTVYNKVQIVPDGSGNWSFATMNTGLSTPTVPMTFIVGPPGLSAYQIWLAAGNTGSVATYLASLIGSATTSSGLSILVSGVLSMLISAVPLNPKWMFAFTDSVQRMLFGIDVNGDTTVGGNLFTKMNLTVGGLFSGLKFSLVSDARGAIASLTDAAQRQLVRVLASGIIQVNAGLQVNNGLQVNGPIAFTQNGLIVSTHQPTSIIHTIKAGQSNALGFSAENALSGTSTEGNLMQLSLFNFPSILQLNYATPICGTAPLAELNIDSATTSQSSAAPGTNQALGDTGCVASADARSRLYRAKFCSNQNYLYTIAAQGASTILQIFGTGMGQLIQLGKQIAAAKAQFGAAYTADWISMDQGESDMGNASYLANIYTAIANVQASYVANSGNANTLRVMARQQSSTPSGGTSGVMDTALAWMTAARAYPLQFFVSQPLYQRNCMIGSGQHIGAIGQIASALIEARTMYRHDYEGGTGNGLRFAAAHRTGSLITVLFECPVAPIVIDTQIVAAIANYGLEYSNTPPGGGSTPTVTAVSTLRPDGALAFQGNAIYITLSADPGAATAETVRYAYTWPTGGDATLGTGARGNIRDSDKLLIEHFPDQVYANGSVGINPYNWCCVDSIAIT